MTIYIAWYDGEGYEYEKMENMELLEDGSKYVNSMFYVLVSDIDSINTLEDCISCCSLSEERLEEFEPDMKEAYIPILERQND